MTLFIRSDESGSFDYIHNDYFVFAGLIFTDRQQMELTARQFISLEKKLRSKNCYKNLPELKAAFLEHKDRRTLFAITQDCMRFATIIRLKKLDCQKVFADKKTKQRYMDYAFKLGLKNAINNLINRGSIFFEEATDIDIIMDERTTATNGKYDLGESILKELKGEIHSSVTKRTFAPTLPNTERVTVSYGHSDSNPLLRAADIIANRVRFECKYGSLNNIWTKSMFIKMLP